MDISGIEPEAFRMQSERDTTTPYTQLLIIIFYEILNVFVINYKKNSFIY